MVNTARVVKNFKGANEEAAARFQERAASQASSQRLLKPDDVAGDYDASRLLSTTLGTRDGALRALTASDLATFKRNAEALGKQFKGGITAQGIINQSLKIDRERSNAQIRVALPRQYADGKMHFVTNAGEYGPATGISRHHVLIDFLDYPSAVSNPNKASEAAKQVAVGKIRCSCDCGRWQFWYSYLATIGKFNSGVPQLGFPKEKNPMLVGAACKHVLRVANALSTPLIRTHLAKMIEVGRRANAPKVTVVAAKDAKLLAAHQAKTADHKRSTVESTAERKVRLAQQRRVKEIVANANAKMVKPSPAKLATIKKKFEAQARLLAQMGGISQKMLADMLNKLHGK